VDKLITTVLGSVAPSKFGIVDAHSHVWIEPVAGGADDAPVLDDEALIVDGLRAYRDSHGSAIVDCQPANCGRNGNVLRRLAQRSGVHLIACTGFHRKRYYAPTPPLWEMSAESAADLFVRELTIGLTETVGNTQLVRAGFIKIAGEATLADTPQHLLEAAAIACREADCAILMHTEKGAAVEAFLQFFLDHDVDPQRLVFCHVDKRADFGFHQELAQAGAMLEYDTFFRPKYAPESNVWPLLEKMIAAGHAAQVALATDMAEASMWRDPGPAAFPTIIQSRLAAMDVPQETINQLMGHNIARRLAKPVCKEAYS
jgi:phosphotriesterase-related protein